MSAAQDAKADKAAFAKLVEAEFERQLKECGRAGGSSVSETLPPEAIQTVERELIALGIRQMVANIANRRPA